MMNIKGGVELMGSKVLFSRAVPHTTNVRFGSKADIHPALDVATRE